MAKGKDHPKPWLVVAAVLDLNEILDARFPSSESVLPWKAAQAGTTFTLPKWVTVGRFITLLGLGAARGAIRLTRGQT